VVREHLRGNVPGYAHSLLIAGLRLRKLGYRMVPDVVKAQPVCRAFHAANINSALLIATGLAGDRRVVGCADSTNVIILSF